MFPDDTYVFNRILVHKVDVDFAVKVDVDSMKLIVSDGVIVFVKKTSGVRNGNMVVCTFDSHIFIKWFHRHEDGICLILENPLYSPTN